MGTITLLDGTTRNPITKVGMFAGVCWGADTSDPQKNYKRGLDCLESGHGRTLECVNVETLIDGYSARVIREWYTHIGGSPTRLQASTRYIDYKRFDYIIPPKIKANAGAYSRYVTAMDAIQRTTYALEEMGMPREDVSNLLPLGMTTRIVDKRNLRNLIDMSHQRMCNRAYWEFRQLFNDLSNALMDYSEEWAKIVTTQFKRKCDIDHVCKEKHGCGRYPKLG